MRFPLRKVRFYLDSFGSGVGQIENDDAQRALASGSQLVPKAGVVEDAAVEIHMAGLDDPREMLQRVMVGAIEVNAQLTAVESLVASHSDRTQKIVIAADQLSRPCGRLKTSFGRPPSRSDH